MNKQLVKEVLQREIGNLEDDAYRYEHFGRTEGDKLVALKRKRDVLDLKIALKEF
jgi:hypothetical protein